MADPLSFLSDLYRELPPGASARREVDFSNSRSIETSRWSLPADNFVELAQRCGLAAQLPEAAGEGRAAVTLQRLDPSSRWRVSDLRPDALGHYLDLFREVFQVEIPDRFWRWKYGDGRGHAVLVWAGEQLVAHYGGVTRPIRLLGAPAFAIQVVDVMVDAQERGVLTRKGPFFLAAASFLDLYIGHGTRHVLGFGFPNRRAMQVAERLGLYAEVGRLAEIGWTPRGSNDPAVARLRSVDLDAANFPRYRRAVDRLWECMRHDLQDAVIGVRDADYIAWRYISHPTHRYHVRLLTEGWLRRPVGLFVVRESGDRCELLDLVAPRPEFGRLIWRARALAGELGAAELFAWITHQQQSHFILEECGVRDPDVAIPTNVWSPGIAPGEVSDRWFLMGGDTDFK